MQLLPVTAIMNIILRLFTDSRCFPLAKSVSDLEIQVVDNDASEGCKAIPTDVAASYSPHII